MTVRVKSQGCVGIMAMREEIWRIFEEMAESLAQGLTLATGMAKRQFEAAQALSLDQYLDWNLPCSR